MIIGGVSIMAKAQSLKLSDSDRAYLEDADLFTLPIQPAANQRILIM